MYTCARVFTGTPTPSRSARLVLQLASHQLSSLICNCGSSMPSTISPAQHQGRLLAQHQGRSVPASLHLGLRWDRRQMGRRALHSPVLAGAVQRIQYAIDESASSAPTSALCASPTSALNIVPTSQCSSFSSSGSPSGAPTNGPSCFSSFE